MDNKLSFNEKIRKSLLKIKIFIDKVIKIFNQKRNQWQLQTEYLFPLVCIRQN